MQLYAEDTAVTRTVAMVSNKHSNYVYVYIKGDLISKGLFKVFICTKKEQKYFCISALASKKRSNQKNKGTFYH